LEDGEDVRRAQSRGEWFGRRRTFFDGLDGGAVCVGGGKSEFGGVREGTEERLGRGSERLGVGSDEGAPRRGGPVTPPDARCAEFMAGKEGACGSSDEASRLNEGMLEAGFWELARGVGGDAGVGFLNSGGGGMAARSSAALLGGGLGICGTWLCSLTVLDVGVFVEGGLICLLVVEADVFGSSFCSCFTFVADVGISPFSLILVSPCPSSPALIVGASSFRFFSSRMPVRSRSRSGHHDVGGCL
jgi:hypothetical protein